MSKEIERRFLINPTKLPSLPNTVYVTQAYLSMKPAVRARVIQDLDGDFLDAFFTVKGQGTIEREEIENEIPEDKAWSIIGMSPYHQIIKKRSYLIIGELLWEIDEFKSPVPNKWIAEVELEDKNQNVNLPEWIVKEITEDSRYSNASLAKYGWPDES